MNEDEIRRSLPAFLLNSKNYLLVIKDPEGRYIYVNDFFKKKFSFITTNFIGLSSFDIIYKKDHLACYKAIKQCLTNSDKTVKIDLRKCDASQENFYWTSWEYSLLKNKNNEPIGVLCLGHDITTTEKSNIEAKIFTQKVDVIIEEITDGFYQIDRDWKFSKVNKRAEQIIGIARKKLLGNSLWDVIPNALEFNFSKQLQRAMNENITVTFEEFNSKLNKWFSAIVYPSKEGLSVFFRNITQEKKNQIEFQNSENKLKAILDSTTDSNILISPDEKIINFNKVASDIFNQYTQKKLEIGLDVRQFFNPENIKLYEKYFQKALNGETNTIEIEQNFDPIVNWLEKTYIPVYGATGNLIGVTINIKNITEKKLAENKIKEQEFMMKAIYQSTSEASSFIDKNRIIRYNNQVAKDISKIVFGKEAQLGDDFLNYIVPKYKNLIEELFYNALKGKNSTIEHEINDIWWQMSLYPVYDSNHQIIGVAQNIQNINSRKEKETKLKENQEQLIKTIEAIPHPLLIVNEVNKIHYVNEQFENVFDFESDEVLGKTVDFLIPEQFRIGYSYLQKRYIKSGGKPVRINRILSALKKDKTEILIDFSINTFMVNKKTYAIIILQDVTEFKKRADTIQQQNQALRAISWQQSHELRRPVANILGLCDLIKNYKTENEETKDKYIDYLLQSTKELDTIIHRIVSKANENEFIS